MAPAVTTIEIARPPEEVFAYVTDPSRFSEWQKAVHSGSPRHWTRSSKIAARPCEFASKAPTRRTGSKDRPLGSSQGAVAL